MSCSPRGLIEFHSRVGQRETFERDVKGVDLIREKLILSENSPEKETKRDCDEGGMVNVLLLDERDGTRDGCHDDDDDHDDDQYDGHDDHDHHIDGGRDDDDVDDDGDEW